MGTRIVFSRILWRLLLRVYIHGQKYSLFLPAKYHFGLQLFSRESAGQLIKVESIVPRCWSSVKRMWGIIIVYLMAKRMAARIIIFTQRRRRKANCRQKLDEISQLIFMLLSDRCISITSYS